MDAATMSVFCPHPALGFQKTGRFFVLNAVSASNTTGGGGNNTAESVSDNAAGSGPGAAIAVRIQALADEIRAMKAQKAPKDDVMAKVAAMVALKGDYEKATGVAYAAPSSSSGSASGAGGKGGKKTGKKEEKDPFLQTKKKKNIVRRFFSSVEAIFLGFLVRFHFLFSS